MANATKLHRRWHDRSMVTLSVCEPSHAYIGPPVTAVRGLLTEMALAPLRRQVI
jgi:hypothetical protein